MAFPSLSFCFYGVLVLLATFCGGFCKIYERCELAQELKKVHRIPESEVATWVCLARHESEFNTSAINHVSGDHGLFQISQLFWCSPPGEGHACGLSCDQLKDEDIKDDVICARRIFREHKRLSGDGFNAWVVYRQHCSDGRAAQYTEGCSAHPNTPEPDTNNEVQRGPSKPVTLEVNTPARRVSTAHVNNIAKHESTKSAGNDANAYNVVKRVSAKQTLSPASARQTLSPVSTRQTPSSVSARQTLSPASARQTPSPASAKQTLSPVSARQTPAPTRATNYFSVKQTQTLKPALNRPHKGFRIINGIVTYY